MRCCWSLSHAGPVAWTYLGIQQALAAIQQVLSECLLAFDCALEGLTVVLRFASAGRAGPEQGFDRLAFRDPQRIDQGPAGFDVLQRLLELALCTELGQLDQLGMQGVFRVLVRSFARGRAGWARARHVADLCARTQVVMERHELR
jgi:hypothetical protein